jgi:hypothetical protein
MRAARRAPTPFCKLCTAPGFVSGRRRMRGAVQFRVELVTIFGLFDSIAIKLPEFAIDFSPTDRHIAFHHHFTTFFFFFFFPHLFFFFFCFFFHHQITQSAAQTRTSNRIVSKSHVYAGSEGAHSSPHSSDEAEVRGAMVGKSTPTERDSIDDAALGDDGSEFEDLPTSGASSGGGDSRHPPSLLPHLQAAFLALSAPPLPPPPPPPPPSVVVVVAMVVLLRCVHVRASSLARRKSRASAASAARATRRAGVVVPTARARCATPAASSSFAASRKRSASRCSRTGARAIPSRRVCAAARSSTRFRRRRASAKR